MDKQGLRERIWQELTSNGVALFPGAEGRIPNFRGAEAAARRVTTIEAWRRAGTIKSNPDAPQRYLRYLALRSGKTVYMAVPRLRGDRPFVELDPRDLRSDRVWAAASIKGAFQEGETVLVEEMRPIDLIVAGSVAVSADGARLGKGGGFSDLEYAICREAGLVNEKTPVVTTVHPLQIVGNGDIAMTDHDIAVDWICTPDGVIRCHRTFRRPRGVIWEDIGSKIDEVGVLKTLRLG